MARNNVQTTVTVGMDVQLAKRNANALKEVIIELKNQLKEQRALMDNSASAEGYKKAAEAVDNLILKIKTLEKVQRSATPATAYEAFISGDVMNSNKLRQAQRGAKNRLNTVPSGASDQTARTLINDINRAQVQLNRLQAGFQKPLQSVKKELRDLSGNELQRLLQLLKQEQTLVQGNDKAWSAYAAAIGKVEERMREYDTLARQQMGASTLSRSQSGGFAQANERDIQRAIDKLREYRAVINDPNGTGKATWEATTREILKLQSTLDGLKQKAAEASGQAMSLDRALGIGLRARVGTYTGTIQELTLVKQTLESNLQTARRNSVEYDKIKRALNAVELELKKTGELSKEVQAVLNSPKGKSFNELKQAVEQGRAALQNMRTDTDKGKKAFDELAKKVKEAEFQMKELGGASKGTASAFDKAWSRLKTYIGLYMGAAVAIQKITATMGDLMELSDKMGEVRKTTGFTADEVGRLSNELKKMDTRTTLTGLMDLSVAAGQLGLKTEEDVLGFTEAANKLMVALPEMGKEGATEMLKVALATGEIDKIRRQMEQGLIDGSSATAVAMEKVGSTIDRLRATSAATAPAITDFVKRVGAVGAQSGISIDQVAALGSTVDALGMRVEMSATALSRMMPAIRNNAFDIAKILGITPDTIRELYDTGQGMEVILMILQRMKDSNMDADSIEQMLGMGGMKEIMKELNQQGARAGIVFGGLSQNVDELRRQLGVAKQAYEENIAIQQEYDKMNETTAAKWERLKNQIEEFFVGDQSQQWLGKIIDGLRLFVDVLTGNLRPALGWITVLLQTFLVYWAALKVGLGEAIFLKAAGGLKAMGSGLTNLISNTQQYIMYSKALRNAKLAEAAASTAAEKAIAAQSVATIKAKMAQEGLNKAMIANIWMAVAAAFVALGVALYRYIDSMREAGREAAKFQAELDKEQRKVNELTNSIGEARVKIEDANKEVAKARAELDAAKKANDGTTEAVNRLTKAESELLVKEEAKKNAMAAHKQLITEFNNQYSKYLGFMLSEVSSNLELARARDLVNSKLRETLTLKRQEAAIERIEKEKGGDRDEEYANLYDFVGRKAGSDDPSKRSRVMNSITRLAQNAKDENAFRSGAIKIFKNNKIGNYDALLRQAVDYYEEVYDIRQAIDRVVEQFKGEQQGNRATSQGDLIRQVNASFSNYNSLLRRYRGSKGDDRARNAAAVLQQMDTLAEQRANASSYYDMNDPREAAMYRKQFGALNAWKGYDRNTLLKEAGRYYTPRKKMQPGGGSGSGGSFTTSDRYTSGYSGNSIWGNEVDAASTDYSTWDVNELVARRNQMNKFKNVLKPGIDVRKVLAEDRALMKAIDEGKVGEDWQSVLNWYNAERKKIQEELKSERFSTNEGNWRDEKTKKGRRRVNPLIESDYALAELDRYYSRRKEALEKARSEENISEELYNRQAEMLEQEHLERRSKLRGTFTGEVSKEETAAFRKWWADLEKMDELDHVPWATVESEWSKALAAQIGRNNLKMQQDMTQVESITMKHVNQIAQIIAKERPYDGITENLQANLTKMDILFADLGTVTKKQLEDGSLTKELSRRMSFLLDETERAYSLTAEQLMSDMGAKGFKAWADAIANAKNADELKRQLLAQLQKAYDAVQDAIKKESSLIKKQAEIQWNDTILPGGISQRNAYEAALSTLGLQKDQVDRANSLIGVGPASERVADKLAIKQMQVRLAMQEQYYALIRKIGNERIKQLEEAGKLEDAEHLRKSLNLTLSEEQKKLDEQRVAIQNQLEESQERLYKRLREWGELIAGSVQSVFEASHAGDKEYYNERAKMALTGKGGPGAGTYVVIDNAGTSGATAHYEHLNERQALERHYEIERQNAMAEAWKKVMDDINMKMSETITDQINAMLQNASIDANTDATNADTQAIGTLTETLANGLTVNTISGGELPVIDESNPDTWGRAARKRAGLPVDENPHDHTISEGAQGMENAGLADAFLSQEVMDMSTAATELMIENSNKRTQVQVENDKKTVKSSQSMFAKMTQAANLYGIAYQAMSNDNLSTTQKFEMIGVQAAGQAAIAALTANWSEKTGETVGTLPAILAKCLNINPIAGAAIFAALTAVIGGLMGMAASKIAKSKSEIAQATGVSGASAGKLTTGMLTYAEGNVNEFTDPSTLREGRMYNVDSADGRTYRARYMGRNPKTHITNGPEFHLSGERGKEMIIDAGTTRQITMNDTEIWRAIQTLSSGRRMSTQRRHRKGVTSFAEGNVDDFMDGVDEIDMEETSMNIDAMRTSLDRNSAVQEALLERLNEPIIARNIWTGPEGIPNMYNKMQKEAERHGEKYV
jgi:TP901 family phage tail tape measure protein